MKFFTKKWALALALVGALVIYAAAQNSSSYGDYISLKGTVSGTVGSNPGGGVYPSTGPVGAAIFAYDATAARVKLAVNGGSYSNLVTIASTDSFSNKTLVSPVISTGLTASGSASNDFSASTGSFKTSTGASTFGGSSNTMTNALAISATTAQLALGTTNVTTLSAASPGGSATVTLGTTTGSLAPAYSCGTTTTCAAASGAANTKEVWGSAPLVSASPSQATVTVLPFTSNATYFCTASPEGTSAAVAAAGIAISKTNGTTLVLTGPNTVTTVIDYHCWGT